MEDPIKIEVDMYKKKYPILTEQEILDVLDTNPVEFKVRVRAAFKLLAAEIDKLEGGPTHHEF